MLPGLMFQKRWSPINFAKQGPASSREEEDEIRNSKNVPVVSYVRRERGKEKNEKTQKIPKMRTGTPCMSKDNAEDCRMIKLY